MIENGRRGQGKSNREEGEGERERARRRGLVHHQRLKEAIVEDDMSVVKDPSVFFSLSLSRPFYCARFLFMSLACACGAKIVHAYLLGEGKGRGEVESWLVSIHALI